MIDFAVPKLKKAKAWQTDHWIVVDFAGLIDGPHGKYATAPEMASNGRIEPYILPTSVLMKMAEDRLATSKRPADTRIKPGSQYSRRHHIPVFFVFKDRWELIREMAE